MSDTGEEMSTSLATREGRVLVEINELRQQLDHIVSIEELRDATSKLRGYDAYAKAQGAKEAADLAVEALIWTEKRAGEIARQESLTHKQIATQFGVPTDAARRWLFLADVGDEFVESGIEVVRASRGHVNVTSVVYYILSREEPTSDPNIFKLPDGRFRVYWTLDGYRHKRVLAPGRTFKDAKGTLTRLKRRRRDNSGVSDRNSLSRAYSNVRLALSTLDALLDSKELPADSREEVRAAIGALHQCEDRLGAASRLL